MMHTLIPALEKQRQVDLSVFEASLVYTVLDQPRLHSATLSPNKSKIKTNQPNECLEKKGR